MDKLGSRVVEQLEEIAPDNDSLRGTDGRTKFRKL